MATVTRRGQVTLPKRVRDALGLAPGAEVDFEVEDGHAVLRKRAPDAALSRWRGALRGHVQARRTDDLMRDLRGE